MRLDPFRVLQLYGSPRKMLPLLFLPPLPTVLPLLLPPLPSPPLLLRVHSHLFPGFDFAL